MEQLFGAITEVLKGLEPNPAADEAIAFAAWKRCAGPQISERTAPLKFEKSHLVIAVADETWKRNLEDLSPQMLVKLNDWLGRGTVKFIEFRVAPLEPKAA